MCMFLLALLLVLEGGKLHDGEAQSDDEPTEDDSQRGGGDVLPGELIGEVVEVLEIRKPLHATYDVSHTADVVVTKSVRHEELARVEDERVVLDGLHDGRDVDTAQGSNTDSGESYDDET